MGKVSVYDIVTDRIIEALEQGTAPWAKPWTVVGGLHRNFNSKRPYTGINQMLLQLSGFSNPFWNTYKGWLRAAGVDENSRTKVLGKGQNMSIVTFAKKVEKKDAPGEFYFMYRYYNVCNYEQLDPDLQAKIKLPEQKELVDVDPIENAEQVWDEYLEREDSLSFGQGGDRAYFSPVEDHIQLPLRKQFKSSELYYSTLFHEAVHSTGMESRCKRGIADNAGFGSESYSKEELVAEMGAAFLCGALGIELQVEHSAAYLKNWADVLRRDKLADKNPSKLVVQAASAAQKAADFILGASQAEPETEA